MIALRFDRKKLRLAALPLVLGVAAFFIVVGPRALNPANIAWLAEGDPVTHYLGWLFFRNSPWSFPIGLNPQYGLELSNAILYSDSNPLAALLFKPLSSLLPTTFQYFGIWLLACFVLQTWFGWKLVGLISDNIAIRLFGAGLFVFSPPMIWRLNGHLSLVGHFLIVAALYLALNPKLEKRCLAWGALLVTSALVHAYLLAMVAPLWVVDLAGNVIKKKLSIRNAAIEFAGILAVAGVACWQVGYFSVGAGTSANGYGFYRMNLLSIFDSSGWSYMLKDIPEAGGDYEGFNFLGLGIIFLLVFALPAVLSCRTGLTKAIGRHFLLFVLLIGISIFAISNNMGLGLLQHEFPLPDLVLQGANVFRASGRMFWPVFYAIILAALFLVVRGYDRRTAVLLLGLTVIIQIVDTSAGWSRIRNKLMTEPELAWITPLKDPFWAVAATKYTKVRYIPPGNHSPNWHVLATYAGIYGLGTDAVYLARVGSLAMENAQRKAAESLQGGNFDNDSLYVLDDLAFRRAALTIDTSNELLARVDGFNVIAPGWLKCSDCRRVQTAIKAVNLFPPIKIGERILFNQDGAFKDYLVRGWSSSEFWGTWSEGVKSELLLPLPAGRANTVLIEVNPLISPSHPKQRVELIINNVFAAKLTLTATSGRILEVKIPEAVKQEGADGFLRLKFGFPDAARPKDIGLGNDGRKLAFGLVALTLR